jgi:N-acetyl-gamma-glutamyl-phosphate reductase
MKKIRVAIIGASGYTGVELIRLLTNHPYVQICQLIGNSNIDLEPRHLFNHLYNFNLPKLKKIEQIDFAEIDVVFGCLPHNVSQEIFKKILSDENNQHLKIIDLSADFRFENHHDYFQWYNHQHLALELQKKAVYGLSEINRDKIRKAQIIACPGCYPTSALLPLIPLLKNKLIENNNIIIDAKSGASGAGRNVKTNNLFCEVNNSFKAYNIGNHRHIGEIQQELSKANGNEVKVDFTPHLLPINRGIISTIYTKLNSNITIQDVKNCLLTSYEDEYFIKIVDHEISLSDVVGTNFCLLAVNSGNNKNSVIITSAIDNLCKGASGQAVQNMNIIFDCDEKLGLENTPIFP